MYVCMNVCVYMYVSLCRPIHLISAYFSPRTIEGQQWVLCPSGFVSGKIVLGTYWVGVWVGPRASLDGRKISSPSGFDPRASSPQSVAIPTELHGPQITKKFLNDNRKHAQGHLNAAVFYKACKIVHNLTLKSPSVTDLW